MHDLETAPMAKGPDVTSSASLSPSHPKWLILQIPSTHSHHLAFWQLSLLLAGHFLTSSELTTPLHTSPQVLPPRETFPDHLRSSHPHCHVNLFIHFTVLATITNYSVPFCLFPSNCVSPHQPCPLFTVHPLYLLKQGLT